MIWVIAGTGDSFEIIRKLQEITDKIIASVVTKYGASKLSNTNIKVIRKKLNKKDMKDLIDRYKVKLIIDASHPFAREVSEKAMPVSRQTGTEYLRFERKEVDLTPYPDKYIITVRSYEEAVKKAGSFKNIFLTIGSKNLNYFIEGIKDPEKRLTVRILPDLKFVKKVREMGLTPANIIAMQGPFSRKLNRVLLKENKAEVLVSKASGSTGGLDTKIKAALDLKIPIIIIKRPILDYPVVFNDIEELISYCTGGKEKNEK